MISRTVLASSARGPDQSRRGRFMGPEIRTPVAAKVAPHRRYVPTGRPSGSMPSRDEGRRGLYAGEPEACRRRLLPFLRSMAQLGLLLAVFERYQIEGRAFLALSTLAIAALPFHYLAPYRWKKPLFAAISIAGLFWIFGTEVGAIVVGLAAVLIGICFLPVAWSARAAGMAALCAGLALLRSQSWITAIPSTVWPVLATMFMFRSLIYMYELKHAKAREPLVDTIGYFLLLPNFCFMHFPVVDYRTLRRGYFAADVHAIQRRGLEMMFRGTIHLLCYRLVYHELLIPAAEVQGARDLAGYLVCNYLLYLRVSG